jgi:mitochondrial fission protein ELM1
MLGHEQQKIARKLADATLRGGGGTRGWLSGLRACASVARVPTRSDPEPLPPALHGSGAPRAPRIWLISGEKAGDNALLRVVRDGLGWPVDERRIAMRERWVRGKPIVRASLHHVDLARSDRLEPPWPDLVITAGRRLSMVALWVRAQSQGRTRIALLTVPRRLSRRFDLIVASAQYRAPRRANVVRVGLPLVRVDPRAVSEAAAAWRTRLAGLPRPITALLVGGPTKPVRFDAAVARQLAADAMRVAAEQGGSLFATTSRRTPAEVTDALASSLSNGARLYRWQPDPRDNPYLALLGLAERFIVTSDSVTMMVEVARLGRPLAVFELPPAPGASWRFLTSARDLSAIPRLLVERGFATTLGEGFRAPAAPPLDDLPLVVKRIRDLVEPG